MASSGVAKKNVTRSAFYGLTPLVTAHNVRASPRETPDVHQLNPKPPTRTRIRTIKRPTRSSQQGRRSPGQDPERNGRAPCQSEQGREGMRNRYGIQEPAPKHRYRIQWHGSLAACDVLASTPGEARY